MSEFYGYRCYSAERHPLGWFYTTNSGRDCNYTDRPADLYWAKRWKSIQGAQRTFEHEDEKWRFFSKGGYLKIEPMPDFEIPPSRAAQRRKEWDAANPDVIRESKAQYDRQHPVISFRPTPELIDWLEEERWDDAGGKPETDAALIKRKLEKLMKLESQGY